MVEVACRQLTESGPHQLRLDDVAAEVGVSRQAVLHHFGSRDGLLRAAVEVAWGGLFRDLGGLGREAGLEAAELLDLIDQVVRERCNARLGAWLLLTEQGLPSETFDGALTELPRAVSPDASPRDASYTLLLAASALFGDAIFGERLRQVLGLPDGPEARADFRAWLATQLQPITDR